MPDRPDFCDPAHPAYDPSRCREWYYGELARRMPAGQPSWPYEIERASADLFEALPARFTLEDALAASAVPMRRGVVTASDVRAYVRDWQVREMVIAGEGEQGGRVYVKTGHRPYRIDLGLLSGGRGSGSNLDSPNA